MPITKATRDVIDLSIRPVAAIDVNCSGGTNLVDNVQMGTRVPNLGYFTNVRANNVQINPGGILDVSQSGVTVLGKLRAYYADVAERYAADAIYPKGTVMQFGGSSEITIATEEQQVVGVISSDPFIILNNEAVRKNEFCPPLALLGRVPCRMTGSVEAGDWVILSDIPGVAMSDSFSFRPHNAIGRVIKTDTDTHERLIEIKVG